MAELTLVFVIYQDGLPVHRHFSPIQVLTTCGQGHTHDLLFVSPACRIVDSIVFRFCVMLPAM